MRPAPMTSRITLSSDNVRRLYPQLRLTADEQGYFEPGAGFLRPEACVETQIDQARKLGARVFHVRNCSGAEI